MPYKYAEKQRNTFDAIKFVGGYPNAREVVEFIEINGWTAEYLEEKDCIRYYANLPSMRPVYLFPEAYVMVGNPPRLPYRTMTNLVMLDAETFEQRYERVF